MKRGPQSALWPSNPVQAGLEPRLAAADDAAGTAGPSTPIAWPPLIAGANVPRWVRGRDFLLTALAWALLAYLMRETLHLMSDYLRAPIFEFTNATPPDWEELGGACCRS